MPKSNWQPGQILPIQDELPATPRLQDLPRIPNALIEGPAYGCPNLVYCIWKSGRHAAMRLTCKTWRCGNCSQIKLAEMSQAVADATYDVSTIHETYVLDSQRDKITKYMRSHKISTLNVKMKSGLWILSSEPAKGKDWGSEEISRVEGLAKIHALDVREIKRRDFTHEWKPESLYEPKKDTVILSTAFSSMADLEDTLEEYGLNINTEYVDGDPLEVMERMTKLRMDMTINFVTD